MDTHKSPRPLCECRCPCHSREFPETSHGGGSGGGGTVGKGTVAADATSGMSWADGRAQAYTSIHDPRLSADLNERMRTLPSPAAATAAVSKSFLHVKGLAKSMKARWEAFSDPKYYPETTSIINNGVHHQPEQHDKIIDTPPPRLSASPPCSVCKINPEQKMNHPYHSVISGYTPSNTVHIHHHNNRKPEEEDHVRSSLEKHSLGAGSPVENDKQYNFEPLRQNHRGETISHHNLHFPQAPLSSSGRSSAGTRGSHDKQVKTSKDYDHIVAAPVPPTDQIDLKEGSMSERSKVPETNSQRSSGEPRRLSPELDQNDKVRLDKTSPDSDGEKKRLSSAQQDNSLLDKTNQRSSGDKGRLSSEQKDKSLLLERNSPRSSSEKEKLPLDQQNDQIPLGRNSPHSSVDKGRLSSQDKILLDKDNKDYEHVVPAPPKDHNDFDEEGSKVINDAPIIMAGQDNQQSGGENERLSSSGKKEAVLDEQINQDCDSIAAPCSTLFDLEDQFVFELSNIPKLSDQNRQPISTDEKGRFSSDQKDKVLLDSFNKDYDHIVAVPSNAQVDLVGKSISVASNVPKTDNHNTSQSSKGSLSSVQKRLSKSQEHPPYTTRKFYVCHQCNKIVETEKAAFHFLPGGVDTAWHPQCFRCYVCDKALSDDDHSFFEDEPYCLTHYLNVTKIRRCFKCKELIYDQTFTSAAGHSFHREHFTCHSCKKPLVDTKFVFVQNKYPFCFQCHRTHFPRDCRSCGKRILAQEPYVQNEETFWHSTDSCFQCASCHRSLIGRQLFFRREGNVYCNRYCALHHKTITSIT